ncbi:uncharacterized protein [Littorina saxatilis]|uniref:uncharacterized protein n=1 Tax=Littorina saxatilis TaxID=31220 RepID=UPI0038B49A4A
MYLLCSSLKQQRQNQIETRSLKQRQRCSAEAQLFTMTPAITLVISVVCLMLFQSTESLQQSLLAKKAVPANYIFLDNLLFESEAASAVDCASSCWKRPDCWSFTVSTTSLGTTCRGHAVWMTSAGERILTATTSLWHMNWLERACSNNTECGVPLSQCSAGKCLCSPGYYYSNSKDSCFEDRCHSSHYAVLDDVTRDVTRRSWRCDNHITTGWYRFILNGIDAVMPTECIPQRRCGTRVTFWLDMQGKELPAVGHETAARGCASLDSCCQATIPIAVRNCGAFYLYNLRPVPWCTAGYCAETKDG